MTRKFTKNKNSESGLALLIAIFTLLLLTAIGAGMVMLTNTDTSISANFRDEQTAFFSAKAGIEEIRDRFRSGANNTLGTVLPTALPGNTSAFLYITNPNGAETVTPWLTTGSNYPDDEVCTELAYANSPCSSGVPTGSWYNASSGTALPYKASPTYAMSPVASWKWTRINLKTNKTSSGSSSAATVDNSSSDYNELVCWTGSGEITTTLATCQAVNQNYLPVYVATTLAVTPSGSRRMVQAEITATTFPNIPGPLVFDGSNPVLSQPNSNAFQVDGTNYSSPTNASGPGGICTAGQASEYALGGFDNNSVTTLQADANKRPNGYTGLLNPNPPGNSGIVSSGNVNTQLGTMTTVGGLQSLVSSVTLVAGNLNQVYGSNPASIPNPGTIANPQINVVQGDLTLGGGFTGAGILLVEGNLTLSGNPTFDGLLLVVGKGSVTKNGGGNGTLDGSMLIANLYDSSGNPLSSTSAPGVPSLNWNGGGTMQMNYDSCWSTKMSTSLAYRIVAVRELIK